MSILFFLIIASVLAIVVGRLGTILLQYKEQQVWSCLIFKETNMSIILFPVVAATLAIVVGRVGTVMLQKQDQSKSN